MEYVSGQKKKMELIFKETFENKENLVDLFYGDEYPKNEDEKNVNVSIYGESIIKDSHKILIQKLVNFNDDLYRIQKHKFRFQISSLVLFIITSIIGVAGYWLRREYIPWVASLLLLLLAAPVFGMAGLETTYTFLSIFESLPTIASVSAPCSAAGTWRKQAKRSLRLVPLRVAV
jgi:hypothetical protein